MADSKLNQSVVNELFLTASSKTVIEPAVIASSQDGGFVVGGSVVGTKQAWAEKLNSSHQVLWTYYRGFQEEDKPAFEKMYFSPKFAGIVPMADGSTFLCAQMPRPPRTQKSMVLLTHLSEKGSVLSEDFVTPKDIESQSGVVQVAQCSNWGKDIVVVASQSYFPDQGIHGAKTTYIVFVFDSEGKLKWEKRIATVLPYFNPDSNGFVLAEKKENLIFSSTDNINTELFSINPAGIVVAKNKIEGRFQLIRGGAAESHCELYGSEPKGGTNAVIFMDDKLTEISRVRGPGNMPDFLSRVAYQLQDGSFVLFGSVMHKLGESYSSGVLRIDKKMMKWNLLKLDNNHPEFYDGGSVWAATLNRRDELFVIARQLVNKNLKDAGSNGRNAQNGAIITFIK